MAAQPTISSHLAHKEQRAVSHASRVAALSGAALAIRPADLIAKRTSRRQSFRLPTAQPGLRSNRIGTGLAPSLLANRNNSAGRCFRFTFDNAFRSVLNTQHIEPSPGLRAEGWPNNCCQLSRSNPWANCSRFAAWSH
jgi:hypothetical protein